jgi:antitoxin PrlF
MPSKAVRAESLLLRPEGATMDEIIAATGGPQYNVLRRLKARGYRVTTTKEGRVTRYFAGAAPAHLESRLKDGKLTLPGPVRQHLGLREGDQVKFTVQDETVQVHRKQVSIRDLYGILPRPAKALTIEEMDEAIREAVVKKVLGR